MTFACTSDELFELSGLISHLRGILGRPPFRNTLTRRRKALASDQIDAVRQFIAAHLGARKVGHQDHSTRFDGRDKSVGYAAGAHVRDQQIDGALPFRLWNPGNDALVGNDASVAFRERDEDEYPAAVFLARDAAY